MMLPRCLTTRLGALARRPGAGQGTVNTLKPVCSTRLFGLKLSHELVEDKPLPAEHPAQAAFGGQPGYGPVLQVMSRSIGTVSMESGRASMGFKPREGDVVVNTYPKSGTTWAGYIAHLIRAGCDNTGFTEMEEMMPLLLSAHDLGVDLDARPGDPGHHPTRVFMNHAADVNHMPPRCLVRESGCQVVHVMRDPKDVVISLHKHMCNLVLVPQGEVELAKFAELWTLDARYAPLGTPHNAMLSWLPKFEGKAKGEGNVLALFYEDLIEDRLACVRRMMEFMGHDCQDAESAKLMEKVHAMTSYEAMSEISHKFRFGGTFRRWLANNPHIREAYYDEDGNCKEEETGFKGTVHHSPSSNVRLNRNDTDKGVLSEALDKRCDEVWIEQMKEKTGANSYQEFRQKHSFLYQS